MATRNAYGSLYRNRIALQPYLRAIVTRGEGPRLAASGFAEEGEGEDRRDAKDDRQHEQPHYQRDIGPAAGQPNRDEGGDAGEPEKDQDGHDNGGEILRHQQR